MAIETENWPEKYKGNFTAGPSKELKLEAGDSDFEKLVSFFLFFHGLLDLFPKIKYFRYVDFIDENL